MKELDQEELDMPELRQELQRLIAMNYDERRIANHIAIHGLQHHGDRLIPGLIECLTDEDAEVRLLAANLLDEAGKRAEPAVNALIERLDDADRSVVVAAVFAIKRLGQIARPAIPALKRLLDDEGEPYAKLVLAGAIGKIAPEDPDAVKVLVAGLSDPNDLHRAASCEFLGEMRNKTAVLRTMQLFSDPDFMVRFASAKAVGRTFNEWMHAVAMCVEMLKDANETNRAMGGECLLRIRHYAYDHLDLLTMALVDAPWDVRLDIEEVLSFLRRQQ